jgi:hypothetical protein
MALFRNAGTRASSTTPKRAAIWDGLFESKSFQIRMPFAYAKNERGLILITHGLIK